jgi:TRAP-type mannitol/chloroaromatic compound transport system permease small subunit
MDSSSEILFDRPAKNKFVANMALLLGASIVPLVLLLWFQWPLREWVHAGHRQANDLAQLVFAFYTVFSVAWASYHQTHLQLDQPGDKPIRDPVRQRFLGFLLTLPWLAALLWFAWPLWWLSFKEGERFIDSMLPGFYILKLTVILLPVGVVLALAQGSAQTTNT